MYLKLLENYFSYVTGYHAQAQISRQGSIYMLNHGPFVWTFLLEKLEKYNGFLKFQKMHKKYSLIKVFHFNVFATFNRKPKKSRHWHFQLADFFQKLVNANIHTIKIHLANFAIDVSIEGRTDRQRQW